MGIPPREARAREARLSEILPDWKVGCRLCSHRCTIKEGQLGIRRVRRNGGGTLHTMVDGSLVAENVDPIEKKPLDHFYPGSTAHSICTPGCHFRCRWCQNAEISQIPGVNDDEDEVRALAQFFAGEIGEKTPWHLNRFYPAYKAGDIESTPVEILRRVETIGREAGLRYVYLGNVGAENDTVCHACGATLVRRSGFRCIEKRVAAKSKCRRCGKPADGVGLAGE